MENRPPERTRLTAELQALTAAHVLDEEQADGLRRAADADLAAALTVPATPKAATPGGSGVLDVLGYIGGALLLGALIFLGVTLWDDLDRTGRTLLAIAALVIPAAGGGALLATRASSLDSGRQNPGRTLGQVLLALACYAAGFAYFTIFSDEKSMVSTAVIVAASALGAVTVRSGAFYVPAWTGAMAFVVAFVMNGLPQPDDASIASRLAVGFLIVGVLFAVAGLLLSKTMGWSVAGLSGWAASAALVAESEHGEIWSLMTATAVAAALFVAFVRLHKYAYAVIGCLILLSIWPVSLYQILDSALGVALGLVAAGGVLIAAAVLLGKLRRPTRVAQDA